MVLICSILSHTAPAVPCEIPMSARLSQSSEIGTMVRGGRSDRCHRHFGCLPTYLGEEQCQVQAGEEIPSEIEEDLCDDDEENLIFNE